MIDATMQIALLKARLAAANNNFDIAQAAILRLDQEAIQKDRGIEILSAELDRRDATIVSLKSALVPGPTEAVVATRQILATIFSSLQIIDSQCHAANGLLADADEVLQDAQFGIS
jgi:hypothetical protein